MINERQTDLVAEPITTGNTKAAVKEAGGGSSDLWIIDPRKVFHDPRDNARPLNQERVAHYCALMLANGYDKTKPIGCFVRKVGNENRIHVHDGQHRYFAALAAIESGRWSRPEVAFDRVPLIIRDARTVDRKTLIITGVTANDGERLTPLELAERIAELQREGMAQTEICAALNISGQTVRDCMLLLSAPTDLHRLIRDKAITSTLAIKTIRDVGADKALGIIEKALTVAAEDGRTKVTQRNLSSRPQKSTQAKSKKDPQAISPEQAKQLFRALQAVRFDSRFAQLTTRAQDAVQHALLPHRDMLDHAQYATTPTYAQLSDHGIVESDVERLDMPTSNGRAHAGIRIAYLADDQWVAGFDYLVGSCGASSGPSKHDEAHATRERAIIACVDLIDRQIRRGGSKNHKDAKRVLAWLADVRSCAQVGAI